MPRYRALSVIPRGSANAWLSRHQPRSQRGWAKPGREVVGGVGAPRHYAYPTEYDSPAGRN